MSGPALNWTILGFIAFMLVVNIAVIVIGTIVLTVRELRRFRQTMQPRGFDVVPKSGPPR